MESTDEHSVAKAGDNPGFIDSEEIDFGSEPFSIPDNKKSDSIQEDPEVIESTELDAILEEAIADEEISYHNTGEKDLEDEPENSKKGSSEQRLVQFPLSKIKQIMKFDPDVHLISGEAIFLVTRAAELFVKTMAKESYTHTQAGKKKTIAKRDVDLTIQSVDTLMFLEGMMNV